MICEMCGKNVPSTRPVFIDGAKLSVCPNCARFGDENRGNARGGAGASPTVIEQRLEKRNRRMQTKNVYDGNDNVNIVDGYGEVIKKARTARGMDLKLTHFALLVHLSKPKTPPNRLIWWGFAYRRPGSNRHECYLIGF